MPAESGTGFQLSCARKGRGCMTAGRRRRLLEQRIKLGRPEGPCRPPLRTRQVPHAEVAALDTGRAYGRSRRPRAGTAVQRRTRCREGGGAAWVSRPATRVADAALVSASDSGLRS
jgi:hypothetical protein